MSPTNLLEHTSSSPANGVTPADLADLMSSFEEAARALQTTHESLRSEVQRLEHELGETRGQLARAQELAALGEMAAGIAHEIRNPLGSIRLYADLLVGDLDDRPDQQGVATKVVRAVDSLNAVVTDVLMFSRELRVRPEPVVAGDLVSHAIDACRAIIESTGARVETGGVNGLELACDPTLMHQALINVIRNACEAPSECAPLVSISAIERSVLAGDARRVAMRVLRVRDNGPGIPPEVRDRMFNPFFTTRATGTGLGLAIVHRILDAHAGRVDIRDARENESAGESGAIVDLMLPLEPVVHTRSTQPAHHPPIGEET